MWAFIKEELLPRKKVFEDADWCSNGRFAAAVGQLRGGCFSLRDCRRTRQSSASIHNGGNDTVPPSNTYPLIKAALVLLLSVGLQGGANGEA